MDTLDTAAPQVDLQHQQDLAGAVQSSSFLSILISLAALLFVLGIIRICFSKGKGNAVLLLGPAGSGKTTLFLQLRDGQTHNGTVASMQENAGSFALSSEQSQKVRPVQLVDIPGHPKVRSRFEGYIDGARGIVFVVDSVDFMGQKTAVADNQIRQTQSTLEDSGGQKAIDIIGDVQEEFTFDVLQKRNGMTVSSISCSALTGNIDELTRFIRRSVPV